MADAQDLKSCGRLLPCGFKSHLGYLGNIWYSAPSQFEEEKCPFVILYNVLRYMRGVQTAGKNESPRVFGVSIPMFVDTLMAAMCSLPAKGNTLSNTLKMKDQFGMKSGN